MASLDKTATIEIGKAAEHLVVADLILSGYRVSMVEAGLPYDLVLDHDGRIFRVQVQQNTWAATWHACAKQFLVWLTRCCARQ